jgi:hypothetical protein
MDSNSELPGIEPRQFELKWMPFEQWQAEKAFMNAAERKMFIHHGLGWLVKFLDDAGENNMERGAGGDDEQHQPPKTERNSRLNIFKDRKRNNRKD